MDFQYVHRLFLSWQWPVTDVTVSSLTFTLLYRLGGVILIGGLHCLNNKRKYYELYLQQGCAQRTLGAFRSDSLLNELQLM